MPTQLQLPTGDQRKTAALSMLEQARADLIKAARCAMVKALLAKGTATADDIRAAVVIPDGIDPVCLGVVPKELEHKGIAVRGGFTVSNRPESHARPITVWAIVDRVKAQQWLTANT